MPTCDGAAMGRETGSTPASAATRRHRRWPWVLGGLALILVVLGGVLAWMWGGRGADEASVQDALERFRDAQEQGDGRPLQPAPGVYVYDGTGTERLSVLGAEQQWGPDVPATVTARGSNCWNLRIEYSTNHRQEFDYCVRGTHLVEEGGRTEQRFDFGTFASDDVSVFTCRPPGIAIKVEAEPGDAWRQRCTGGSTTRDTRVVSAGTNTFVGIRTLRVGGVEVDAFVYRIDRTLAGDQSGTEHDVMWFAVDSGLPLRYRRDAQVRSPSPLGAVDYTEAGTLTLTDLTPRS
jgi:hypothetical protein